MAILLFVYTLCPLTRCLFAIKIKGFCVIQLGMTYYLGLNEIPASDTQITSYVILNFK